MINSRSAKPPRRSPSTAQYRAAFVSRVHQLLYLGYCRLTPTSFAKEEEPSITGELVRVMDNVIDDPTSPSWVRMLHVHDDPPVHSAGRRGKRRCRIDIRFVSNENWPRDQFNFEAKRLGPGNNVGDYLGKHGLGCFLDGTYAKTDPDAGMLGYIQNKTPDIWADSISKKLSKAGAKHKIKPGTNWEIYKFKTGPDYTYRTCHKRKNKLADIDIYHTFLVCF